jgi:hypothetical protein
MPELNIALAHLVVEHGCPERNLDELLRLFNEAADEGAQIAVGPEMSFSGYCFESREEITPFVQETLEPAGTALGKLAKERGIYLVAGWAERDPATGIFYNSAFVFSPDRALAKRYRKISAESRWACPGPAAQDNVFDTPWGHMGLLICSDTYYGLPTRVTAIKGADPIFVPANWPPGGLDPCELWRQRDREKSWPRPGAADDFPRVDFGPARILLASLGDLIHPELALAAAKWGCDFAVASESHMDEERAARVALRPIEQLAVAACVKNGAAIGLIPQGHQPGRGAVSFTERPCSHELDTGETRRKKFQDRIDYEALFSR